MHRKSLILPSLLKTCPQLRIWLPAWLGVLCYSLLLLSTSAQAVTGDYQPESDPSPGGVAVIELPVSLGTELAPVVYFQGQQVFVMNRPFNRKSDNRWLAWVGIPRGTQPGKVPLVIEQPNGREREIMLTINSPRQAERYIISRSPVKKNLSTQQRQQILADERLLTALISRWSNQAPDNRGWMHPTRGGVEKAFGERIFINGELHYEHQGVDLSGQRANAPVDGIVVLVRDLFYGGKTVVIDHGRGLFTHYSHLDKVNFRIREGQRIRRGEEIGKIGRTGHHIEPGKDYAAAITQPHLHWAVTLNGVYVDPERFLQDA